MHEGSFKTTQDCIRRRTVVSLPFYSWPIGNKNIGAFCGRRESFALTALEENAVKGGN